MSPLEAPRLLLEPSGGVRLDWIEPVRGAVKILRTADPLAVPAGTRLPANEAEALDGHRIEPALPDRAYDPEPPAEGHCYYTPLTVWNGMYTVGHGVALSRVPDPSDLRATRGGGGSAAVPVAFGSRFAGSGPRKPAPRWSSLAKAHPRWAQRSRRNYRDRLFRRLRPARVLDAQLAA